MEKTLSPVIQNLIANMVYVEGGTFTMGATSEQGSDANSDEKPSHSVCLSSFSIGRYEVTQEEWEAVMDNNCSRFRGAKRPVENVSWDDCQSFIRKLNTMTGMDFRLPTEAEWEYAARGGNKSGNKKFSGSDKIGSVAWYRGNSDKATHPVGQKNPNELGLYDMSGNVNEWCSDWYGADYYGVCACADSPQNNPKGPEGGARVLRGGSWFERNKSCRTSARKSLHPLYRQFPGYPGTNGLRIALSQSSTTQQPVEPVREDFMEDESAQLQQTQLGSTKDVSAVKQLSPVIENLIANMVNVEGGTFTMGATSEQGSDANSDEKPSHNVSLSSFSIGRYEVTQEEWEAVMGTNPSHYKNAKNPVESVSWDDCQIFIDKLNEMTGKKFRLPTEAEWEYAARGGSKICSDKESATQPIDQQFGKTRKKRGPKRYKYAGSNVIDSVAWYNGNSNNFPHPVGQKDPNELGLYDMSGNVFEWCSDWYCWNYYKSSPQNNPKGFSEGCSYRVYRGGSWNSSDNNCRVSCRTQMFGMDGKPSLRSSSIGLRLAL